MKNAAVKLWVAWIVLMLALLLPGGSMAQELLGRVVVFGASLDDSGNAFALTHQQNTPPYNNPDLLDALLVPSAPYATGGHHFSNGATWIEQLALQFGGAGSVGPAFQDGGLAASNYAVGGARARTIVKCPSNAANTLNLERQVATFLHDYPKGAPADALYVIDIGGNDVRDALSCADPSILSAALAAIGNQIGQLYQAGARKFLVVNVPDIGLTPAIRKLGQQVAGFASLLSQNFNIGLDSVLIGLNGQLHGIQIAKLNLFNTLNGVVANGAGYGLTNVQDACIMPNIPTFQCASPDTYLFWDGIHPTQAGHKIIEQAAATALGLTP